MKPQKIKLGAYAYEVRPQPIGYLMNELGPEVMEALEADLGGVDGLRILGAKTYDVLKVFIPDLMPRHEFLGFESAEALARGREGYDREKDKSPSAPQTTEAFKVVKRVNGGEVLDALKAVVSPEMLRKGVNFLVRALTNPEEFTKLISTLQTSGLSLTSPSTSGESASTSSGTPSPTQTAPESAD